MFVEVLQGFGGYWINSDTLEVGLDSPEAIASVQFLLDTIKKEFLPLVSQPTQKKKPAVSLKMDKPYFYETGLMWQD